MNSILITGCNRGLGLGLVKALLSQPKPPKHIFATCRNLELATELKDLAAQNSNVHILEVDLCNFNTYDKLVNQIEEIAKDDGLNVLFNNAGMAIKSPHISALKEQDLLDTLQTNTVVPIMLVKACLPLLNKAARANQDTEMSIRRAAIINMSSILGSIEDNKNGGMYAYRISKAALNAATKSMSIDLYADKILCVTMHPGWVRTDMGGTQAPLDVETSVNTMIETILGFNESNNGGFFQYDGKKLPW